MARKCKSRLVDRLPNCHLFKGDDSKECTINLSVDEYECVRCIDYLGLNQEETGIKMGVGRTTIQAIYDSARRKIAQFIVLGSSLSIGGGNYVLNNSNKTTSNKNKKGDKNKMKIAIAYENGEVFEKFGKAPKLDVIELNNDKIVKDEIIDTNVQGHNLMVGLLEKLGVDTLICNHIGQGAVNLLNAKNIKLFAGVEGKVDAVVQSLIANTLLSNNDAIRSDKGCHHNEGCCHNKDHEHHECSNGGEEHIHKHCCCHK